MPTRNTQQLDEGWYQGAVDQPVAGFNGISNKAAMDDKEGQVLQNLVIWPGVLRGDTGLDALTGSLPEIARICERFIQNDGTEFQLAITDGSVYVYDTTASEWQYAFTSTVTTLNGAHTATDVTIDVVDATGFAAGNRVGILLDDGTMHKTTIASINVNEVTIDDGLPSAAASGKTFGKAYSLNGSASIQPDFVQVTSHDWFVVTNGVDTPFRFDGVDVDAVGGLVSAFTTFTARAVAVFENQLYFANTVENGTAHPQRVRRSDTGNPEEYVTGTAGFNDLFATPGVIKAMKPLGEWLIAYKANSIIRGVYVGQADLHIDFETVIPSGSGAVSPRALAVFESEHYVVSYNGIFLYRGDLNVTPLSNKLIDYVFGSTGDFGADYDYLTNVRYVDEQDEVFFVLPNTDGDSARIWRLHVPSGGWTERQFLFNISCIGTISVAAGGSWAAAEGTWAEQVGPWVSTAGQGQAVPIAVGDADNLNVKVYDYVAMDDAGTTARAVFTTKEFIVPNKQLVVDRMDVFMRGTNATIEKSTDGGASWQLLKSFDALLEAQRIIVWNHFTCKRLIYRFSADMTTFELQWFGFLYREESPETDLF